MPPINEPIDTPATISTGMSCSYSDVNIPTCAAPLQTCFYVSALFDDAYRAPPPPSTSPIALPVSSLARRAKCV